MLHNQGIYQVVVAGLVSQGCVRATCQGALKHGFQVLLVKYCHSNYRRDAGEVIRSWNQTMAGLGVKLVIPRELLDGLP